jgi:outer membrane autotransporter protein
MARWWVRESAILDTFCHAYNRRRWATLSMVASALLIGIGTCMMASDSRAQQLNLVLSKLSGDNQTGVINAPLPSPLVVQVTTPSGTPAQGVPVGWRIASGLGTLGATTTTTDLKGQASNTLTLGPTTGPVTVEAAVPGSLVTFNANNGTLPAATNGLGQFAQLANVAIISATTQTTNIGVRLAALRRGSRGITTEGLSLAVDGQPLPLTRLASLSPMLERTAQAGGDRPTVFRRLGIFLNGQGNFGDQRARGQEPGFNFHTAGATLGVDYRFTEQFILGAAFGYLSTASDFDAAAGDFSGRGFSASAFGTYYLGDRFYVDLVATYGWNDYDTTRNIPLPGVTARGETDGTQFALSVGGGYNFNLGGLTVGPVARVDYIKVDIDGFRESGAGIFDLDVASQTATSVTTALGGRLSYAISMPWGVLVPAVHAEWQHEFDGDSRLVTGSLVADPLHTVFAVQTTRHGRDYANVGAAVSATFAAGTSAFISYDAVVGRDDFSSHGFTAGVRVEF